MTAAEVVIYTAVVGVVWVRLGFSGSCTGVTTDNAAHSTRSTSRARPWSQTADGSTACEFAQTRAQAQAKQTRVVAGMEHYTGRCCSPRDQMTPLGHINRLARNEVDAVFSYFVVGHVLISMTIRPPRVGGRSDGIRNDYGSR
jgi:hypothetical protein